MKSIYPLETYLHIFQLEGYSPARLISWWITHLFTRKIGSKKPLVWTSKATWLYFLTILTTIVLIIFSFLLFPLSLSLPLSISLIVFPILQLVLSFLILKPYEIWNKQRTINKTREKIRSFNNLKVIGITGSYGKTSVKEYLYGILKTKYHVLRTPKSYNTVFGIAKVVEYELDKSYDYFICEMGAYKCGEINELCNMVQPKYGILTGIAQQHLDRFGSLENIIKGKFELPEFLPENGLALLNTDNQYINDYKSSIKAKVFSYGFNDLADGKASNTKLTASGSTFDFQIDGKEIEMKTKLLGQASVQNIAGSATLAYKLGMSLQEIADAIEKLETVPFRLELMKRGAITIINDAYNSNTEGFKEAVTVLNSMPGKKKVLVTPGIVDLGKISRIVHEQLGMFSADKVTDAILVGKSDRTKGLEEGFKKAGFKEITVVNDLSEAQKIIKAYPEGTVVLFENDLPDNY